MGGWLGYYRRSCEDFRERDAEQYLEVIELIEKRDRAV